jgi:GH24 family phage-related lysozyme (muramidase)
MISVIDLIKAIQAKLGLPADGDPRGKTWLAIANALGSPASASLITTIQVVQRKLGLKPDGDPREKTWTAIAKALGVEIPADPESRTPDPASRITSIPQRAVDLILEAEGVDQPYLWPGGDSGITIGFGYDLGYEETFVADWKGVLPDGAINALQSAVGVKAERAARMAAGFRGIKITRDQALKVFCQHTLPQETAKTLKAFPGLEKMPDAVRGALVSLVFNRGPAMEGERRREMRNIRQIVSGIANGAQLNDGLKAIAQQFRSMKRLWAGRGLDGLLVRREAEAKLVESAIT